MGLEICGSDGRGPDAAASGPSDCEKLTQRVYLRLDWVVATDSVNLVVAAVPWLLHELIIYL